MLRKSTAVAVTSLIASFFTLHAQADEASPWTGSYIGANAGGTWGNVDVRDTNGGVAPGPFSYSPSGFIGGGVAGFNWQTGNIVFGVEGDLGYMDLSGSGRIPSSNPAAHQDITLDGGLYGDVTARVGFTFENTLIYGKGGFAFFDGEADQATTNPGYKTTGTDTFTGWTAGGGIEHFITSNLSIKAEYQHFDFGSQAGNQTSISDPPIGFVYRNKTDVTAESVKVGLAYHF